MGDVPEAVRFPGTNDLGAHASGNFLMIFPTWETVHTQ